MEKLSLECLYCGKRWEEAMHYAATMGVKCSKCSETKLIRTLKNSKQLANPFGYPPDFNRPPEPEEGPANRDADPPPEEDDPFAIWQGSPPDYYF